MENFGDYILRYMVIKDILKEDTSEILYWSGKRLFSKFKDTITTTDQLVKFFNDANFGELTLVKENNKKFEFKLSGKNVSQRIKENLEFSLENGLICEYVQTIKKFYCTSETKAKSNDVIITVTIGTTPTIDNKKNSY